MYLAVPLRGDFQLDCELTSAPERDPGRLRRRGHRPQDRLEVPGSVRVWPAAPGPAVNPTAREARRLVRVSPDEERRSPDRQHQRPQGARRAGAARRRPLAGLLCQALEIGHGPQDRDHGRSPDSRKAQPLGPARPGRLAGRRLRRERQPATTPTGTSAARRSSAGSSKTGPAASRRACCAITGRCSRTAGSPTSFITSPAR